MNKWVLDASAILAYLKREPGWQTVENFLRVDECIISTVNYAEVAGKLAENGLPEDAIRTALDSLELKVRDFDVLLALKSGLLRPLTKALGLSLGDRACLILAQQLGLPALTADSTWETLALGIPITVIR